MGDRVESGSVAFNIVRIANVDLDGRLPIHRALTRIKGVGWNFARMVEIVFCERNGLPIGTLLGNVPEEKWKELEDIIKNPVKYGIPAWAVNTRKDYETGKDLHFVGVDLDMKEREILKREAEMRSYRGLRRMWGLRVRGQRTKSHPRKNKVSVVGRKKR